MSAASVMTGKRVPFTMMIPEHAARLMQRIEEIAPGALAAWAVQPMEQSIRGASSRGDDDGSYEFAELLLCEEKFESEAKESEVKEAVYSAWRKFLRDWAAAAAEEAYAS